MQETLIQQGTNLMLFGMGSVFVFLTLLVLATTLMSKFVQAVFPEAPVETKPAAVPNTAPASVDARVLEVIKQAVKQHRDKRGR